MAVTDRQQTDQSFIVNCFLLLLLFIGGKGGEKSAQTIIADQFSIFLNIAVSLTWVTCKLTAFLANNRIAASVIYLIYKLLPWQQYFFPSGRSSTTDTWRSNWKDFSKGSL